MNRFDFLTNIPLFFKPSVKENLIRIFNNYIKYQGHNKNCLVHVVEKIPLLLTKN